MIISLNDKFTPFLIAFVLFILVYERVVFNLSSKNKIKGKVFSPWLTYVPFLTYIIIIFVVLLSTFFVRRIIDIRFMIAGMLLFVLGIVIRRSARHALGDLWSMAIEIKPRHKLVKSGIYRYFHHPYSLAVMFELIGFSIMFQSWVGFVLFLIIQLPLLMVRNRTEERILRKYTTESRLQEGTMFDVIKQFGLVSLIDFISINNAMKHYNRYFMLTNCITALLNVGFFDALQNNSHLDIECYAKEKKLDFTILDVVCDYLMAQRILEKDGKVVKATRRSKFLSDSCKGIFDFITAYRPIFDNMEDMLRGKVMYGRDIFRHGKYVAAASAHLARRFSFPIIKSVIARNHFKSILDLGCGSGEFLETLKDLRDTKLSGIDISKEAITYAKERLIDNNIRLEVCDMFEMGNLRQFALANGKPPEIITLVFVLHEFASSGISALINYLNLLRANFPDSRILIYELFRHEWHELRQSSSVIKEHHLFHFLSKQSLLNLEAWHDVFHKSGYAIEEQKIYRKFGQGYFLLRQNIK